MIGFFFFKQKTAYEMRISDWSSDVCSSDLANFGQRQAVDADKERSGPGSQRNTDEPEQRTAGDQEYQSRLVPDEPEHIDEPGFRQRRGRTVGLRLLHLAAPRLIDGKEQQERRDYAGRACNEKRGPPARAEEH